MDSLDEIKIVTLCGSAKFEKEFQKITEILTLRDNIVISLGMFSKNFSKDKQEIISTLYTKKLDLIHKKKIDLADIVFIMNVDSYIGDSTKEEIAYATLKHKKIIYLTEFDIICRSCGLEWCTCHLGALDQ